MIRLRTVTAAALVALIVSCGRRPIIEDVQIEFADGKDEVVVTADTRYEMKPADDNVRRRVDAARALALSGGDPWALRFAGVHASEDSTLTQHEKGVLSRLTRSVTIPQEDLQIVLADTNVTVRILRGDGWREVAFYPGSSARATREQQNHFQSELTSWSGSIARYYRAMDEVYRYLGARPQRARWVFQALLHEQNEDGSEAVVLDEEQPLVETASSAMLEIADRLDQNQERAASFEEEADLVYNPFPSKFTIKVPGTILAAEGFKAGEERKVVIEPVDLMRVLEKLEGKWLAPDPLAQLLRDEPVKVEAIAAMPRRSTKVVSSTDIANEIRSLLKRPEAYVVRWRE